MTRAAVTSEINAVLKQNAEMLAALRAIARAADDAIPAPAVHLRKLQQIRAVALDAITANNKGTL